MVSSDDFRLALRHFAAGVTIVTVRSGEQIAGLTVSAFASVAVEPPLILVVVDDRHSSAALLREEDAVFAVNVLGEDQQELSDRFARVKSDERFQQGSWSSALTGAPILTDAVAWLDCRIHSRHPAGTHTIYVGAVQAIQVNRPDAPPLVYWNRAYRRLALED